MSKLNKMVMGPHVINEKTGERYYRLNPGELMGYMFYCPGCEEHHPLYTAQVYNHDHAVWQFNGNEEKPSFTPSLVLLRSRKDYEGCGPRCHLFVTDGNIQYLSDCEHALAGKTIPLPDIPE